MTAIKHYDYYAGIDPGQNTGVACWCAADQFFLSIQTMKIHRAFETILFLHNYHKASLLVRLEDARQVRFNTTKEKAQGAGSVKRDVGIWIDFLEDNGIPYELVRPNKSMTKWPAPVFAKMTGYDKPCSVHGRDAAMLVFQKGQAKSPLRRNNSS